MVPPIWRASAATSFNPVPLGLSSKPRGHYRPHSSEPRRNRHQPISSTPIRPAAVRAKRVLDTVCCDLIQDQAEWYCAIDRQLELVGLHVDFDPLGLLLDGKTKPQAAGRQRRARPQRERFAEVFEENQRRQWVPLSDIPEHVQKAFLAAEDKRFYRHKGIDERGLIRAFIGNLAQSGRPQGGSTITQQIVKNLLVGEDLTYDRKIREMIVASRVEHTLSKADILSSTSIRFISAGCDLPEPVQIATRDFL